MTSDSCLLVIGGTLEHLRKAHSTGADIVYCQFEQDFHPEAADLVNDVILTDYTDWEKLRPLVQAAHRKWGFTAAASLTEPGLDPVARVNDLLGLGGTSYEVSHRFTDKWQMRRRIAETEPENVPIVGASLVTDRHSIAKFGAAFGYPFIVKPSGGTASFGVMMVTGEDSVDQVWAQIRALRADSAHPLLHAYDLSEFIMEEYIAGPLCSAEVYSFGGRHVVMAITEAISQESGHVHVGHALPARITPALEATVVEATTDFLDAMGLRDGPSHTELKLSPRGPVVIESQNRIGGALINSMIKAVYGIDPQQLAFSRPLGLADELTNRPAPAGGAASWLVVAEPGRVQEVCGLEEVRTDPATIGVTFGVAPGDMVRPLAGSWDGLGHIATYGPDTGTAIAACRANLARIEVRTEPAWTSGGPGGDQVVQDAAQNVVQDRQEGVDP